MTCGDAASLKERYVAPAGRASPPQTDGRAPTASIRLLAANLAKLAGSKEKQAGLDLRH